MKLCVLRISVFVAAAAQVWAQSKESAGNSPETMDQQRMESLEFKHGSGTLGTRHVRLEEGGADVISLQTLRHSVNRGADRIARTGMREFRSGHLTKALPLLQEAVVLDPKSSAYENDLGVIQCILGNDKEAQKAFQAAIEVDPGASLSYQNLSSIAFNTYQYKLSEEAARRALQLTPLSAAAKIMLALSQIAQNHWTSEAKKVLQEYRSMYTQADRILKVWPLSKVDGGSTAPGVAFVKGAGPGAFRLESDQDPFLH